MHDLELSRFDVGNVHLFYMEYHSINNRKVKYLIIKETLRQVDQKLWALVINLFNG